MLPRRHTGHVLWYRTDTVIHSRSSTESTSESLTSTVRRRHQLTDPLSGRERCTPTAAYWPCPVVSFGPGDSFEERYREHRRTINKYRSSTSYDLRVQGNFRLLRVALYLLWRRSFRRWYCNYRGELAIREHNKHHIQDTPLSPGGDTDAYTSEPEDEQQSECTFDSDSEATQEYIPSDDDSEPTQVHIPSGGLAAPA